MTASATSAGRSQQLYVTRGPTVSSSAKNRTIKDATVKRIHYYNRNLIRQHFADFVAAHNLARRLKTLRGLTPYEA